MNEVEELVNKSLDGNLNAFKRLIKKKNSEVIATNLGELILKKTALISILNQLREEKNSKNYIQQWASFVKRGYFFTKEPLKNTLDIEYEDEGLMVEVLSRLDELGDIIDGEMSLDEIDYFINILNSK